MGVVPGAVTSVVPALIDRRTLLRVVVALAASIVIHAAALGTYGPGGTAGALPGIDLNPVIHAVLAPSQSEPGKVSPKEVEKSGSPASGRSGAEPGPELPVPDRWFRRSELDAVAVPARGVQITYPEKAISPGGARVQVRLFIDERGVVRKITVESPGPERAFEETAMKAWHGVPFSPAMKDGLAVKSQQVIEVEFQPPAAQE